MSLPDPKQYAKLNSLGCVVCSSKEASDWVSKVMKASEDMGRKPNYAAMRRELEKAGIPVTNHMMKSHVRGHRR